MRSSGPGPREVHHALDLRAGADVLRPHGLSLKRREPKRAFFL